MRNVVVTIASAGSAACSVTGVGRLAISSIEAAGKGWGEERRACREHPYGELQTWERAYQSLPVPGEVNGATDAQRADAYRAAIRACLRLIFGGSVLNESGAKAWPERVWTVIQQYGVGRACDLEGSPVESSGYETALYDILDWYRDVAARTRLSNEGLGRASPAPI